jgi:hypothetical protein
VSSKAAALARGQYVGGWSWSLTWADGGKLFPPACGYRASRSSRSKNERSNASGLTSCEVAAICPFQVVIQDEDPAASWEALDVTLLHKQGIQLVSRSRDSVIEGLGQRICYPCYENFRTCSGCSPSACLKATLLQSSSRLSSRPREKRRVPIKLWLDLPG